MVVELPEDMKLLDEMLDKTLDDVAKVKEDDVISVTGAAG